MNETEHLLTILAEECAEVAQRVSKAIRFGLSEVQPGEQEDNKRRIEKELGDLMATAELLGFSVHDEDKAAKREKLKKFMGYARDVGTLTENRKDVTMCPSCGMAFQPETERSILCRECEGS